MGTSGLPSLALAAWTCGCVIDGGAEVQSPATLAATAPMCVCAPTTQHVFVSTPPDDGSSSPYSSTRPPSIDLGYIGDTPIGLGPQPHHRLQEWEKPFRLGGSWSTGWGRFRGR